jgi:hypothetical protein
VKNPSSSFCSSAAVCVTDSGTGWPLRTIRSTMSMKSFRCAVSFTKKVASAYASPRMKAPYFGWFRIASRSATALRAGSSPTFSSHSSMAAGVVMNLRNFTAASRLGPVALGVMPLTQ